mgnify:CR=1 FL=1
MEINHSLKTFIAALGKNSHPYNAIIESETGVSRQSALDTVSLLAVESGGSFDLVDYDVESEDFMSNDEFYLIYSMILHNSRYFPVTRYIPNEVKVHYEFLKGYFNVDDEIVLFPQDANPPLTPEQILNFRLAGKMASISLHTDTDHYFVAINYLEVNDWSTRLISEMCRRARFCKSGVIFFNPQFIRERSIEIAFHSVSDHCFSYAYELRNKLLT